MLIEFSVANFRSFRERQTLSMVAAPRLRKRENTFKPELSGEKFPALLKACVIYGPNASGKSNLLRALSTVDLIANLPPSSEGKSLPVSPFGFDPALADEPSSFEIHFIHQGMRYQFELSATADRIHLERLHHFPRGKETLLYQRKLFGSKDQYFFGDDLEGGSSLHDTWKKLTPRNMLFLSQAVANSSEDLQQLRSPLQWLKDSIFPVLGGMRGLSTISQKLASDNELHADSIANFLQDVDVPISKVFATPKSAISESFEQVVTKSTEKLRFDTKLTHHSALGEAQLSFEDQSEGTKSLFGFWLPWSTREPWGESARCVLAVDELDSSLHPRIVVALVSRHLASKKPSQLIFTTHDTHLMDAKLLRRDQFWLTERDANGATQLRSLHDFEGREGEDIEKRYFEGRYRSLPIVKAN